MLVHYLQHVPFEDPAYILEWVKEHKHQLSGTQFHNNELPPRELPDLLIIMGGPMSIHDEKKFPWLADEKAYIKKVIDHKRPVLGICLGAQLLADVLGARVYTNPHKEIGWFPVTRQSGHALVERLFPDTFTPFHWHGETFDIPKTAIPIGASVACKNQGFIFRERVIAIQFHLESTPASISRLIQNCSNELTKAPFIQSSQSIQDITSHFGATHTIMKKILSYLQTLSMLSKSQADPQRR